MARAASTVVASGAPELELDGPPGPREGDVGVAGVGLAGAGSIDAGCDGSPAIGGWNRGDGHPVKREAPRGADRRRRREGGTAQHAWRRSHMFTLNGKTCVVTGSSRGLGRAIALAYAAQGADLVLTARTRDDLEALRGEIESLGRRALVRAGDVTDLAHLRAVGDAAVAMFGRLDVWVNNAGGDPSIAGGWAEWLDVTEEGWERMLRLNLKAQVVGAETAARPMKDGGRGGAGVLLRSIGWLHAAPRSA